ncbi:MAG: tripartite tricarboxylate transporter TctB family protein [Oscillospiraceae bacterium]
MRNINRTKVIGIFFALVAVLFFIMTFSIEVRPNLSEPGPRIFPFFAEALIFVCALVVIFGKKNKQNDGSSAERKPWLTTHGWKLLGLFGAELLVYAFLLQTVGFIIASLLMMMAFIYTLHGQEKIRPLVAILISIFITLIVYYMFTRAFGIMLPSGMLFM